MAEPKSLTDAKTNKEKQSEYRDKMREKGYAVCRFWVKKEILKKAQRLSLVNEKKQDEQFSLIFETGLQEELKKGF